MKVANDNSSGERGLMRARAMPEIGRVREKEMDEGRKKPKKGQEVVREYAKHM